MLPNITFILQDCVGGVAYMNHQIIKYGKITNHFNVRIILFKNEEDLTARFTDTFTANEVEWFSYSIYDNYFKVLKRLNKVINKNKGIVVTNDGIELKSIELFGTNSLVYSIVHDFYNFKLAIKYYHLTDVFICHTQTYTNTLKSSGIVTPRIDFLPHGVVINMLNEIILPNIKPLKIVSIGRLIKSKGVLLLFEIENLLVAQGINVEWVIIGSGILENDLKEQWKNKLNITFIAPLRNEEVMSIAKDCDVFVSPSEFEGYGIALLEAMACGLVPIVYELPVGISAILPKDVGFKINVPGIKSFSERIILLHNNRTMLLEMKRQAYLFVSADYNIVNTSNQYLQSFLKQTDNISNKKILKKIKTFGLFDKWFIPNKISREIKIIKKKLPKLINETYLSTSKYFNDGL